MTHDELLERLDELKWDVGDSGINEESKAVYALRAVVELHHPLYYRHGAIETRGAICAGCYEEQSGNSDYPCPTIQTIEKELR